MAWTVFVSAKRSLAAYKLKIVVTNLAQERHVHHMDLYTNYIGRTQSHTESFTLSFITCLHDTSLSIIEVMCISVHTMEFPIIVGLLRLFILVAINILPVPTVGSAVRTC